MDALRRGAIEVVLVALVAAGVAFFGFDVSTTAAVQTGLVAAAVAVAVVYLEARQWDDHENGE